MIWTPVNDIFVVGTEHLAEGKSIGTAKPEDIISVRDIVNPALIKTYATIRRSGGKIGRVKLKRVQERTTASLSRAILRYSRGKLTERAFRKLVQTEMKRSWRDVFLAGSRATRVAQVVTADEEKWLKGAMAHEMTFLNKFMTAIVEDSWKMPLQRRIKMYVDSLAAFYESARVIGLPSNVIISWLGPRDKATCVGCAYMFEHSPYTKFNLPTVPKAGLTSCLTSCRDRLRVKLTTPTEVEDVNEESRFGRRMHVENLRKLKKDGFI